MEPMSALQHLPLVRAFMTGQPTIGLYPSHARASAHQPDASVPEQFTYFMDSNGNVKSRQESPAKNSVAVHEIIGTVMKYGSSFSYGISEIEANMKAADANPNIIAHVLVFDTPGGSVYGTLVASKSIRDLKKPTIGFVDSMCCSAGMELISGCDVIYASHEKDLIGSIGTMMSWANLEKWKEWEGIAFHEVYATLSTRKNKDFREADEGKYKAIIENLLDPLNEDFLKTIRENIPQINALSKSDQEYILSGPTFFADQGMSYDIIDGILTFEAAIERAFQMAPRKMAIT